MFKLRAPEGGLGVSREGYATHPMASFRERQIFRATRDWAAFPVNPQTPPRRHHTPQRCRSAPHRQLERYGQSFTTVIIRGERGMSAGWLARGLAGPAAGSAGCNAHTRTGSLEEPRKTLHPSATTRRDPR